MWASTFLDHLAAASPSLLPILLDAAVKGLAILTLTTAATLAMRRSSAAARHLVWFLSATSLLILPILSVTLPAWYILPHWIATTPSVASATPSVGTQSPSGPLPLGGGLGRGLPGNDGPVSLAPLPTPDSLAQTDRPSPSSLDRSVASSLSSSLPPASLDRSVAPSLSTSPWPLLLWLTGATLLLAHILLGSLSLRWLQHRSTRITSGDLSLLLRQLRTQLALRRPVDLLSSPRRAMPMTWGLWHTRLLLPADASTWSLDQQRAVLLHELAHARRWDCLTQFVTQLACALHWFNPLIWLAWHRMQTERERACDDLVLSTGATPSAYAEQLLHIASDMPPTRFSAAAIAMARPSKLEGRLLAILDTARNRRSLTRASLAIALTLIAAIVLPISILRAAGSTPAGQIFEKPGTYSAPHAGARVEITVNADNKAYFRFVHNGPKGEAASGPIDSLRPGWFMCWDSRDRLWVFSPSDGRLDCYYGTDTAIGSTLVGEFGGWDGIPDALLARLPDAQKAERARAIAREPMLSVPAATPPAPGGASTPDKPTSSLRQTTFADRFVAKLSQQNLPFLDAPKLNELRARLRQFAAERLPENLPADRQHALLQAIDQYVETCFGGTHDADSLDRLYLEFPDAIQTFQWQLWFAARRESLSPEQEAQRQVQHQWIRQFIRSLPSQQGRTHADVLASMDKTLANPLDVLFSTPMDPAVFERFKQAIQGDSVAHELAFVKAHCVSNALNLRYPKAESSPLPFEDRLVAWGQTNGRVQLSFASNQLHRGTTLGLDDVETSRQMLDVLGPSLLAFPADLKGERDVDKWLAAEGHGHVGYDDAKGGGLFGVRGTKLFELTVRSWINADQVSDNDLRTLLQQKGQHVVSLAELHKRDRANPGTQSFVGVLTGDEKLAVVSVGVNSGPGAQLHVRPRPATPPADADEPYRQLYTRYRDTILKAAQSGDSAQVEKLTDQFNQTIGGRLISVVVDRLDPPDKFDLVLSKGFGHPVKLPAITNDARDAIEVTHWGDNVTVEKNLDGSLHIRLDLNSLPAATQPTTSVASPSRHVSRTVQLCELSPQLDLYVKPLGGGFTVTIVNNLDPKRFGFAAVATDSSGKAHGNWNHSTVPANEGEKLLVRASEGLATLQKTVIVFHDLALSDVKRIQIVANTDADTPNPTVTTILDPAMVATSPSVQPTIDGVVVTFPNGMSMKGASGLSTTAAGNRLTQVTARGATVHSPAGVILLDAGLIEWNLPLAPSTVPTRSIPTPATTQPAALRTIDLTFQTDTMQNIVAAIRERYPIRLCFENLDFDAAKDAVTLDQALRELEAAQKNHPLSASEKSRLDTARRLLKEGTPGKTLFDVGPRYTRQIHATSPEDLLNQVTRQTPYTWQRLGDTYIIRPAAASVLGFPVRLKTAGLTVSQAVQKITEQSPAGQPIIGLSITLGMPTRPGQDPTPWLSAPAPILDLNNTPAIDALCQITQQAHPASVWELAGYHGQRSLSLTPAATTAPAASQSPTTAPASPSGHLDFRILIGRGQSAGDPWISDDEADRLIAELAEHGPDVGKALGVDRPWFPLDAATRNPAQFPVAGQYQGRWYVLASSDPKHTMLADEDGRRAWGLVRAYVAKDSLNQPAVGFDFDQAGTDRFRALTSAHLHQHLAAIVDGQVVTVATIQTVIASSGILTNQRLTAKDVSDLVAKLQQGMPPVVPPATEPATFSLFTADASATIWAGKATLTIRPDGSGIFGTGTWSRKGEVGKWQDVNFKLTAEQLTRLQHALEQSDWLRAKASEMPGPTDTPEYIFKIERTGETRQVRATGGNKDQYSDLIAFVASLVSQMRDRGAPITSPAPATQPATTSPTAQITAEIRRLAQAAIATKYIDAPQGGSDQQDVGLDLGPILALTGQQQDLDTFTQDHRFFDRDVQALAKSGKVWALAALLNHPNADAKILAARALRDLADPQVVPVLLAAAKRNGYVVSGSENATIHRIYVNTLATALRRTISTDNAPHKEPPAGVAPFLETEQWLTTHFAPPATRPDATQPAPSSPPASILLKNLTSRSCREWRIETEVSLLDRGRFGSWSRGSSPTGR